ERDCVRLTKDRECSCESSLCDHCTALRSDRRLAGLATRHPSAVPALAAGVLAASRHFAFRYRSQAAPPHLADRHHRNLRPGRRDHRLLRACDVAARRGGGDDGGSELGSTQCATSIRRNGKFAAILPRPIGWSPISTWTTLFSLICRRGCRARSTASCSIPTA